MTYRRTFRAIDLHVVPVAGPVPDRDGARAGLVRRRTAPALGGVPYLVFLAPGLLAATAMQSASFEATFPIMGGLVWSKVFHAMYATPITPRDIALGNLLWIAARLTLISTVFTSSSSLFGAAAVAAHRAGHPGRGADRDGVRRPDRRVLGDPEDARQVHRDLPVRDHAAVPLLGDVLPDQLAAGGPPGRGLADAALPWRRADPRRCRSGPRSTTRSRWSSTSPT